MNLGVGGTHIQTIADANWDDNGGNSAKLPESPQCEVNHRTLEPQSNFPSLSLRAPAICLGRTSLDWLAKKGELLAAASSQNELLPPWASSFWAGGRQCLIHFLPILGENKLDGNSVRVNFTGRAQDKKHILNRGLKP